MMNFKHSILNFILLIFFSNLHAQCYDINISSGVFADSPMTVGEATEVTYEFCNDADPIPMDPNGGLRINICPSVNNLLQVSTFSGSGTSFFSFASFVNCSIAEQFTTIPTGCFEIKVSYEPKSISHIGEFTGNGENTGVHCISTNIIPSGIVAGNSCNESSDDGHSMCNYSIPAGILSVDLKYFKAQKNRNTSLLTWETDSEINNDYFLIERSVDGKQFESLGNVPGNGTTDETQSYSFTDQSPLLGSNYYRLQQVDLNGTRTLSAIQTVQFDAVRNMTILPNPASEYIRVQGIEANCILHVLDLTGKVWKQIHVSDYADINVSDLPSGNYLAKVKNEQGEFIHTQKLFITH